jgi:hypothetical protein
MRRTALEELSERDLERVTAGKDILSGGGSSSDSWDRFFRNMGQINAMQADQYRNWQLFKWAVQS